MTTISVKTPYCEATVVVEVVSYTNGRACLLLTESGTGDPFTTVTTNMPEIELDDDEVIVKTVDENEGILDCLVDQGVLEDTGRRISNCFQVSAYAICRLVAGSCAIQGH